ncbi:MAG: CotH kinase family protein [Clostridia bacterium]|nr:CotH kinase family protein [Clostridia bacterium]
MKKSYWMLAALTAVMLCVMAVCVVMQRTEAETLLEVDVCADGRQERISCWKDPQGNRYVFLPSYADLSNVCIRLRTTQPVLLDGAQLTEGMNCAGYQLDTPYQLSYTAWGRVQQCRLTFAQSRDVPVVFVDTYSRSMETIHAKMGNEESGSIRLYQTDGVVQYDGKLESIKGRGNFTWNEYEKKPYSLTLAQQASLLEMGEAQKWILLANASDASHMRNRIACDFAEAAGLAFSPDAEWVDLYLNGEYAGLYLLSERNEVHPERVAISETEGVLLSVEARHRLDAVGHPYVLTDGGVAFRIHYPETLNENSLSVLRQLCASVENAAFSADEAACAIDLDSWAGKYLVDEIFANADAGARSHFVYFAETDEGAKAYAGPVWDYDLSMGNAASWQFESPRSLAGDRLMVSDGFVSALYHQLLAQDAFREKIKTLYREQYQPLLAEWLNHQLPKYAEQIEQAGRLNQIRWQMDVDVASETKKIISFLTERMAFLSDMWLEGQEYVRVQVNPCNGSFYAHYAVRPGECLTELPQLEGSPELNFDGWYYDGTEERFDPARPIETDTKLYALWTDKPERKIGQLLKLMPVGILAAMGLCILIADMRRMRKGG